MKSLFLSIKVFFNFIIFILIIRGAVLSEVFQGVDFLDFVLAVG